MIPVEQPPIACTLTSGDFKDRLAWVADLNSTALLSHQRHDLRLELVYAAGAAERVRELVRREQKCCAFLSFTIREGQDAVRLSVEAPERAREAADLLFEQFHSTSLLSTSPAGGACACAPGAADQSAAGGRARGGSRVMNVAAASSATAALACGVCCVLPFALPAVALTSAGGVIAAFAGVYWWALGLAVAAVAAGWLWVGWQSARARIKPARSTLYSMISATLVLCVALSWSFAEPYIIALLKA